MGDAAHSNVSIEAVENELYYFSVTCSVSDWGISEHNRENNRLLSQWQKFNKCSIIHPTSLPSSARALAYAIDASLRSYCRSLFRSNLPAMEDWTFQFATCRAVLKCSGWNEGDDFGWGWKQRLCGRHYPYKSSDKTCIHQHTSPHRTWHKASGRCLWVKESQWVLISTFALCGCLNPC